MYAILWNQNKLNRNLPDGMESMLFQKSIFRLFIHENLFLQSSIEEKKTHEII